MTTAGTTPRRGGRPAITVSAWLVLAGLLAFSSPPGWTVSPAPTQLPATQPRALPSSSDFDRDGYADLVAGRPEALTVVYGSAQGLTAARTARWTVPQLIGATRAEDRQFGPAAAGDFDADGYADLAVWVGDCCGDPGEGSRHDLVVLKGTSAGLTTAGRTVRRLRLHSDAPVLVSGNFGRGRPADLAIGDIDAPAAGVTGAGSVRVLYGDEDGLASSKVQTWTLSTGGVAGIAHGHDDFGSALAAAPFAGRGVDDLAISNESATVGDPEDGQLAGAVHVLYGSADGLTAAGSQRWVLSTPGLRRLRFAPFGFGTSLTVGYFAGGRHAALAIGSPQTPVRSEPDEEVIGEAPSGTVNVLYGGEGGLRVAGNQLWRVNRRGVKGLAGEDFFGASLAAGELGKDRDGWPADDLVIGAPRNHDTRGSVHVLYGSRAGLASRGDQVWRQSTKGIVGASEPDDRFGDRVVVGDFGRNGAGPARADLAVASTAESISGNKGAGSVHVLYGTDQGIGVSGSQLWTEDRLGGVLAAQGGDGTDGFGSILAAR